MQIKVHTNVCAAEPFIQKTNPCTRSLEICWRPAQGSRNWSYFVSLLVRSLAASFCGDTLHHRAAVFNCGNKTDVSQWRKRKINTQGFDVCSQASVLDVESCTTNDSVSFCGRIRWLYLSGMSQCSGQHLSQAAFICLMVIVLQSLTIFDNNVMIIKVWTLYCIFNRFHING